MSELLSQFDKDFADLKKELKFTSSLEELDSVFFFRDSVLKEGYVSTNLSKLICSRIVNIYMSWTNYLHSLVMPNPSYMISMTEHQMFTDEERQEIINLINKTLALVSQNSILNLGNDKKAESKFVDDSLKFWNKTFQSKMIELMKKINQNWNERANSKE